MWESESESGGGRDYGNGVLTTSKHGLKTDGFEQRGHSWYVCFLIFLLFDMIFLQFILSFMFLQM